jgi:hypothetical protein
MCRSRAAPFSQQHETLENPLFLQASTPTAVKYSCDSDLRHFIQFFRVQFCSMWGIPNCRLLLRPVAYMSPSLFTKKLVPCPHANICCRYAQRFFADSVFQRPCLLAIFLFKIPILVFTVLDKNTNYMLLLNSFRLSSLRILKQSCSIKRMYFERISKSVESQNSFTVSAKTPLHFILFWNDCTYCTKISF